MSKAMAKKRLDEEKFKTFVEQLKEEIAKSEKGVKRADILKLENLALALVAYKDENGNVSVLINVHGQKPSNSLSFPADYIDDFTEIAEILNENKDVLKSVLGTREKSQALDLFKSK